ncbi:MAG: SusD/RagB family nutrient-binding outer membrane lipoprotein [Marinilabiliaceae bacterium]|nr:SusD/RagB family nutrient-binding outer membrane lipoprotein [Marinilabiliaceae bacterium]
MKKIYIAFIAIVVLIGGNGCSDDFGDMNVRKDATTSVEPQFFFNAMLQEVFANYQRNVNLYPDLYSQYWANTVSGFASPRYEYVDGWIGNQWKEHYTRHLRQSLAMDEMYAEDPLYVDALAIKEIWMCYWWSRMTDTYGDIPYFEASTSESVPYHSQKDIYYDLLAKLDKAITSITGDAEQYKYDSEYDLMFKGDAEKWKRFGNSLRLRLAMRLSNVDPSKAKVEVDAAVNGPGGLLAGNADVAKVPMWQEGWYDYLHQMAWFWDNIRCSKTFMDNLYNQSSVGEDPRTPIWFTYKVEGEATSKEDAGYERYEGLANGYNLVPSDAKEKNATINLEGGYVDFVGEGINKMYCPVMFYSEVKFLMAEAALRGWVSGDANALFKEGIQASMEYVGVDADAAQAYLDGVNNLTGSNEAQLKKIITQKWLANFPNGVEGWADFRRTDYPDLSLPVDGVSGSSTVAEGTWVKRVRYPDNEHRQNEDNMPNGMQDVTTDRMDIKVWWDVADTKTKSNGLMSSNF